MHTHTHTHTPLPGLGLSAYLTYGLVGLDANGQPTKGLTWEVK